MKTWKLALLLSAVPLAVAAQDAAKVDAGHYKVLIDNPSVRVLKVSYSPGAKSPMHSHPDALLVSLQDSKVVFTTPDGKTQDIAIAKETASYMSATTHASPTSAPLRWTRSSSSSRRRNPAPPACPARARGCS